LIAPVVALGLSVVAACDGPTRPFLGESIYVARAVDDVALPAAIIQHDTYESILLADTLRFSSIGIAARVSVHRNTLAGEAARIDTTRYAERFVIRGDSLSFLRYCPPNALCVGPPTGTFSPDRQQLFLQLWSGGPVITFERST
jgi:hypothetical protein